MSLVSFFGKFAVLAMLAGVFFLMRPSPLATQIEEPQSVRSLSLAKLAFNFASDASEPIRGEERDRVNVLFLGMTGVPHPAPFLTDTIILASIKPSSSELHLLSLPRDLLVQIPGSKAVTKINALYQMRSRDPEWIRTKVAEITGQPVDYYLALDVSAVVDIVDTLGGINVLVPESVRDPRFPVGYGKTEHFAVERGWRYFDGVTAQRYLRTRHSQDGDFARMRQQQAVLEALRKKVFGLNLLYDFPTILALERTVASHIGTDLDEAAMKRLYDIAKTISYENVRQTVVDGDPKDQNSILHSKTVSLGGVPAFALVPKTGDFDYYSIQEIARNAFTK